MTTVTLKIDQNSKKGKAFLEFVFASFSEEGDVQVVATNGEPLTNDSQFDLNLVAENGAKYKAPRKDKKTSKKNLDPNSEESPYNPEFVKMVLEAAKGKTTRIIDPNDIWGSLGLK